MNKIFVPDGHSKNVWPSQKEMDYMKKNLDKEVPYPHFVRDEDSLDLSYDFSIRKTVELMKENCDEIQD